MKQTRWSNCQKFGLKFEELMTEKCILKRVIEVKKAKMGRNPSYPLKTTL